jgi:hypothetical protein
MVVNWKRNGQVRGSKLSLHSEHLAPSDTLRYKPEVRRLYSQWCHWNFSLI